MFNNTKNKRILKKKIFEKIKEYCKIAFIPKSFIPGKSKIFYAGRVFDAEELINAVDSILDFWLTAGRFASQFEKEFAEFLGMKYCLLTNSGSSANLLAISALTSPLLKKRRLRLGDEIITTACGFPTTIAPIIQNRLVPVFVDVELGTYNIDTSKIERVITKKTKVIFIAHTLGNPADLDKIMKIVKKYNLWFIEDNCDSLGAKYKGKYTGTFGHISTCSFYPPHLITMGEGGAVLTNDPLLRRIILSFRDWGRDCYCEPGHDNTCGRRFSQQHGKLPFGYDHKYVYSHLGYNLKITDMQAAIGCVQLKKLSSFIEARKKNFNLLYEGLRHLEDKFILPVATKDSEPSWFGFLLTIKENAGFTRNKIVNYLESNGIQTRALFAGNLIRQPCFDTMRASNRGYRIIGELKNTDIIMNQAFWVGVYPGITEEMIEFMVETISKFMKNRRL
jgi:CDP-6-deoxy-D-xylo-4-hexulose-3-dehydrase